MKDWMWFMVILVIIFGLGLFAVNRCSQVTAEIVGKIQKNGLKSVIEEVRYGENNIKGERDG
jgi:hypothetical protein